MVPFATQGIVLRTVDFGEADRIVTLFSRSHGKFAVFVPGARRSKRRSAQALDLFCQIDAHFASRRAPSTLLRLGEFKFIDVGANLRHDLAHIVVATLWIECLSKLTIEMDPHPEIFDLTQKLLENLAKMDLQHSTLLIPAELLKLLKALGFAPQLRHCVRCQEDLLAMPEFKSHLFLAHEGGVVCRRCLAKHPEAPEIEVAALKALQQLTERNVAASRLHLPAIAKQHLYTVVLDMIESVSGRELRSRRLLPLIWNQEEKSNGKKAAKENRQAPTKN